MATFRIETNTGAAHVWATSALEACERARDMAIRHGSDRWRVYATRAGSRSAYGLAKGRGQPPHVPAGALLASGANGGPVPRESRQGEPKESPPRGFVVPAR